MLNKLIIKNVALIECAQIDFASGLNVLSGETGSGKSVIIDSLNFVLGAKADKSLIRSGENECYVSAEFDVSNNNAIYEVYDEFDLDKEDLLIITRKFSLDGKSSVKVNGSSMTAGMLKKFTSKLVDIYGQSEHFDLLSNTNQLKLIDRYGGDNLLKLKEALSYSVKRRKDVLNSLDEIGGDENQRLIRIDLLNFQINEIENANLQDGEEEYLKEVKQKLSNQEKIITALQSIKSALKDEGGASDILANSTRLASGISSFGDEFSALNDRLNNTYAEIDDLGDSVSDILDSFDFSELNIDDINFRLDTIKTLKRKYGNSYAEIMDFLDKAIIERDNLENAKDNAEKLLIKKKELERVIYNEYIELDNYRRKVSVEFSSNVLSELCKLGMPKAKFSVNFTEILPMDECNFDNVNSFNHVEFVFSANAGEELKSLSNVISGGEMSRFMLALKSQTAKFNDISTFVFDEIDAGISGNTAKVVAEKFNDISQDVQILAISHLPQVSAMADNNILISKSEQGNRTITSVKCLTLQEKIFEVVRLSGGEIENNASIEHAKTIIQNANNYKNIK